jgi:hypothetical protein
MWFGMVKKNPFERGFVRSLLVSPDINSSLDSYTVKVGDICFVAIGQIVGREYQAVRYQPTACIVINSPVEDRSLCGDVRKAWQSQNPKERVLQSLLIDYATRSRGVISPGEVLPDGFKSASDLQIEAALRLLYYYPNESAGLIADRLKRLDVKDYPKLNEHWRREIQNGLHTPEFIKAVAWSDQAVMKAAIEDVAKKTDDKDILDLVSKSKRPR